MSLCINDHEIRRRGLNDCPVELFQPAQSISSHCGYRVTNAQYYYYF